MEYKIINELMDSCYEIKRIDDLGRIVIPKEVRKILKVKEGQPFFVFYNETEGIIAFKIVDELKGFERLGEKLKEEIFYCTKIGADEKEIKIINQEIDSIINKIKERENLNV